MSYKVYAGTQTAVGVWDTKACIYDPTGEDLRTTATLLISPTLTREAGKAGSFEFTLPLGNVAHSALQKLKTIIEVEQDGAPIWRGRVMSHDMDFYLRQKVYCEGELAYLNDTALTPYQYQNISIREFLENVIRNHNRQTDKYKAFAVGNVTVFADGPQEPFKTVYIKGCYTDSRKDAEGNYDYWLKDADGRFVGSVDSDYLDGEGVTDENSQTVEFGVNMLDLNNYVKADNIVTRVIAVGYQTKGWWIFKSTKTIQESANDKAAQNVYGIITRVIVIDGKSITRQKLLDAANEELRKNLRYYDGIEVSAIDLHDAGIDTERLIWMKKTRIVSKPHGIDTPLVLTKVVEPLDAPDKKKFTFGTSFYSISDLQALSSRKASMAYSIALSSMGYLNGNPIPTTSKASAQ